MALHEAISEQYSCLGPFCSHYSRLGYLLDENLFILGQESEIWNINLESESDIRDSGNERIIQIHMENQKPNHYATLEMKNHVISQAK